MSLEELAALPGVHVGTKEAAAVLGCDRYSLNIAAKQGTLNLKYMYVGNRLKISKASLLEYCGYGENGVNSGAVPVHYAVGGIEPQQVLSSGKKRHENCNQ